MTTKVEAIDKLLNQVRSKLGTGENPPGSNSNFIVDWYNRTVERIGNGPWCEMMVTWAMWVSGFANLKRGRAYTVWGAQDAQKAINGSSWHWGTDGMMAGDQVYYDWGGAKRNVQTIDHTGIVERIVGDGTFYTLEGNVSNSLRRMRRDSKYVVGYVRFAWYLFEVIQTTPPVVPKKTVYIPDRNETRAIQQLLEVSADGMWGPATDAKAMRMRSAAQGHVVNVREAQAVVNTTVDGIWGPNSKSALGSWVRRMQIVLHVSSDGAWGPITDNAFLSARKRNLNNY